MAYQSADLSIAPVKKTFTHQSEDLSIEPKPRESDLGKLIDIAERSEKIPMMQMKPRSPTPRKQSKLPAQNFVMSDAPRLDTDEPSAHEIAHLTISPSRTVIANTPEPTFGQKALEVGKMAAAGLAGAGLASVAVNLMQIIE
jgi:hypothetical protein